MQPEFRVFNKIGRFDNVKMDITQKIHGTNAQVCIYEDENKELQLYTASRTRIITPYDDNFGFANFVYTHKHEFIEKLGLGIHYGEWAGPGINSGEGLTEKSFVLFNWRRFIHAELPPCTKTVPVLYNGPFVPTLIKTYFDDLKTNGSKLVSGYMKPEGIVINIDGKLYKKVFDVEEVAWTTCKKKEKVHVDRPDVSHLLQPKRLEKLLSRDERYLIDYPKSLSQIASDYVADLIAEKQIDGDDDRIKSIKRTLGSQLFKFIKENIDNIGALNDTLSQNN